MVFVFLISKVQNKFEIKNSFSQVMKNSLSSVFDIDVWIGKG